MKNCPRILFTLTCFFVLFSPCVARRIPDAKPEDVGMSTHRLHRVRSLILEAVSRKEFPGAVLVVARRGKIVFREAFGQSQWIPERRSMDTGMIFDLASLTKPIAAATSIMILVEQGKIRLWDKVTDFVPEFTPYVDNNGKIGEDARLWHLLTHTSGLPSYIESNDLIREYGEPISTKLLVKHISQLEKTDPPGMTFHYSCLDFITLGYIVKVVSGQLIDQFARENIFAPLGMKHTVYNPSSELRPLCVPTEFIDGKLLIGIVHDPLARLQSGISGNAGLFSTADDLSVFAQMMLNGGTFQGHRILSPLTVGRLTSVYPEAASSGRGLGWDLCSAYSTNGGDIFGPHSYGHTGYTGTSIWIDPDTDIFIVFLTNRVHPYDKGAVVAMRSKVANIVAASVMEK